MTTENIVQVFKAFSDESRVKILGLLKDGEMCGNSILEQMQISQSTLSHHMKLLCESGVVTARKDGKWTYYSISLEGREIAKKLLDEILDAKVTMAAPQPGSARAVNGDAIKKKPASKKKTAKKPMEEKVVEEKPVVEKPVEEKAEEPKREAPVKRKQLASWLL